MTVKLVPFKKEHLDCMDMRAHEASIIRSDLIEGLEQGACVTGMYDGRIITCGGIIPTSFGNADIWQIPSVYVKDVKIVYCKYIRNWIDKTVNDLALRRLETLCLDDELHTRWMSFLGFQREGIKRQWVEGQDYALWARLYEVK